MKSSSLKIGQILINMRVITPEILQEALSKQKNSDKRIGEILVENNFCTEQEICMALSKQFNVPYVDLDAIEISPNITNIVPGNIAIQNMIIPLKTERNTLTIAVADPLDYKAINAVKNYTKLNIDFVISEKVKIKSKHRELYTTQKAYDEAKEFISSQAGTKGGNIEDLEETKSAAEDQPIIRFVNNIIEEAIHLKASDIHVEPLETSLIIRYRIDGKLIKHLEASVELAPSVTSRIKYISGMNIAEKRIPQDGRLNYKIGEQDIDLRISSIPVIFGEKVVMRITTALGISLDKESIGFLPENIKLFDKFLSSHRGIILLTGATGSGKTTTLYTAIKEIMREDINIVTIENPVEMIIPGVAQVDINDKAGLTFANVLRSILRQDPDVIMIGEIRDKETAEIAASAAITGHLVLSTLHTYNAASSIVRLIDMGVAPFMVTSAILGVVSQRLVRRLCLHCRQSYIPSEDELKVLGLPTNKNQKLYREKGCERCNRTGFKGRIAVHEIMPLTPTIKTAIHENISTEDLNNLAIEKGMMSMKENLKRLLADGIISVSTYLDTASKDEVE